MLLDPQSEAVGECVGGFYLDACILLDPCILLEISSP